MSALDQNHHADEKVAKDQGARARVVEALEDTLGDLGREVGAQHLLDEGALGDVLRRALVAATRRELVEAFVVSLELLGGT